MVGTFIRSESLPEPLWYRVTFPYVLHPFKWFSISSSIFMVVAISAERHRAICSPLTHRPAFWPYAVMVFCVAGELGLKSYSWACEIMGHRLRESHPQTSFNRGGWVHATKVPFFKANPVLLIVFKCAQTKIWLTEPSTRTTYTYHDPLNGRDSFLDPIFPL